MKKRFSKKVSYLMEKNIAPSLRILLEKEENDSIFDLPDDEEENKDSEEVTDDEEVSDEDEESKDDDSDVVTKSQFEELSKDLAVIKNTIMKTTTEDGIQSVESFIANAVSGGITESKKTRYSKKSIKGFLFEDKDVDAEAVEADIEVLDSVLTKGVELVNKFKKGQDIDIEAYVNAAINAYKNFDNLFSKEEIVKQASINVLVLNSGAKAEKNIAEFEELFYEELNKQFGIEHEEHALITKKFNAGAGARSQG